VDFLRLTGKLQLWRGRGEEGRQGKRRRKGRGREGGKGGRSEK